MFIHSASKASRLSFFARFRMLLGFAGVAVLALCFASKASATVTTYHATGGYCEIDPGADPGSQVNWNFVLNPTSSNPSTLVATSNYNIEFALGDCFWSNFAPAGTVVQSGQSATLTIDHKIIYNSGEGGSNPAGHAKIVTPFGSILQRAPNVSGGDQVTYGPTTTSWNIPVGTNLSTIQVEDQAGSGNLFTDSMEVDILSIYITYNH